MEHMLVIEQNRYVGGYDGYCECIEPDYVDEVWTGFTSYHGLAQQDVIDQHHDHLLEAGVTV